MAGAAGEVVTVVVPIFTVLIVPFAVKPRPEKSTVEPRAAELIGWLDVLVNVTLGFSVKGVFTTIELSVSIIVYEPWGRPWGSVQTAGPRFPAPSVETVHTNVLLLPWTRDTKTEWVKGHPLPVTTKFSPARPDEAEVSVALNTVRCSVAEWLSASVTVTVFAPAAVAAGTVKVTPLNWPVADVGGVVGVRMTAVVPTLTEAMVLLPANPCPLRKRVWPAATDVMGLPVEVPAT